MIALLPLLSTIIAGTQAAQEVWAVVRPILEAQRDPTAEEWATLNALADRVHAQMQQAPQP